MDDGGAVYEAAFVLGAAGEVDGAPVRVLAHYRERTYSGELAVQVSVDGQHAPEIVCGYSD